VTTMDEFDMNAFHWAAKAAQYPILKYLITHKKLKIGSQNHALLPSRWPDINPPLIVYSYPEFSMVIVRCESTDWWEMSEKNRIAFAVSNGRPIDSSDRVPLQT